MRVLVCGSRDWNDGALSFFLSALTTDDVLIEGGARGADALARVHALVRSIPHEKYPAKWDEHDPAFCPGDWCRIGRSYCVGAGPRRNQQMLDEGKPELALAFKDGFNWKLDKGGTEDMVKRAKAADIPTYVISRA